MYIELDQQPIYIEEHPDFVTDLILQRTGVYSEIPGSTASLSKWFQMGDREGLYKHLISSGYLRYYLEKTLRQIMGESNLLLLGVGNDLSKLVSVGPGNGLVEMFLMRSGRFSELLLIDIEKTEDHHHGFTGRGAGYCDLKRTVSFINKNTQHDFLIKTCNPLKEPLPDFEYNLLISILSMGFHYPCDEYLNFVKKNAAKPHAALVLDKRRDTIDHGFTELSKNNKIQLIAENEKSQRLKITLENNLLE